MATITYRNYKIETSYIIVDSNDEIVDEYCDRKEALHYYNTFGGSREGLKILACAAEWIDDEGNLNTAVKRNTMAEALKVLKSLLA